MRLAAHPRGARRPKLARLALPALVALAACGETVLLADPPVEFSDAGMAAAPTGPAHIELGVFKEQFFTPLGEGDLLPIVSGFQGGVWAMPAIRSPNVVGAVVARGSVTMDDGEIVGETEDPQARMQSTAAGFSEMIALPIPIAHAEPFSANSIDDLFGRPATLAITVTAGERTATATLTLTLTED